MKDVVDYLSGRLNIANKSLLEKDILLHKLLLRISKSPSGADLLFKGGTCLTKCYLGYYRFSEDLDFTYAHQAFGPLSQKELRRTLSKKIDAFAEELAQAAHEVGLSFRASKADKKYIELGGSDKMATFKLWYTSCVTKAEQFVKIQVNYVELLCYAPTRRAATRLWSAINPVELALLFPQESDLLEEVSVSCYDILEILLEKVRAILTRQGIRSRDFIDVYLIATAEGIEVASLETQILEKTRFSLRYDKYLQNLHGFDVKGLVLGEEKGILLTPLDKGFPRFLSSFIPFADRLSASLKGGG